MTSRWMLVILAGLLAGCTLGPAHRRAPAPSIASPPVFRGAAPATTPSDPASLADLKWFELFKDERLQDLIRAGLARNYDLRDAALRVEAARANLGIRRADQLPDLGASADLTSLRFSRGGSFPLPEGFSQRRTFGGFAANLLSYEVDLWGRLRRASDSARASLLASEENRKVVVTTLVSEVASAYFNLLSLDAELQIARRTLTTREDSRNVIQVREQRGLATLLDVRQAEQLVNTATQSIFELERAIEQTENQISLLVGDRPGPIPRGQPLISQWQPLSVPPGLPSSLLERRPDIRAAEQSIAAANASVDVARAAYFPRISLTGLLGTQSDALSGLFSGPTRIWQFAPQVSQPFFTGGRLRSTERLAETEEHLAVIQYERAIQTAFREVADAIVQYRKTREIREQQETLVVTLQDRSRLAYLRYEGGVDTLLNALDADRDLFGAELGLTRTRRDELLAMVQLYRALGGGWRQ
ncbi:MAG: efflux transporter outer membrane subunit [Bryobacteraceae bacterium]|nr:efflux transporter outer membrane subunit [Bryobacteraceae bacterium]